MMSEYKHNLDELFESSKNFLLLQGPIGGFFYDLAKWLELYDKTVFKLNLNMGDEFFYPNSKDNTFSYKGKVDDFCDYLISFCERNNIESIICFGDTRSYHQIAKLVSEKNKILFWVFEEGYLRPDYITLEKVGVNDFSILPRVADFYLSQLPLLSNIQAPEKVALGFIPLAKIAIKYYFYAYYYRNMYPNYQHHRILDVKYYIKLWSISGVKRVFYYFNDSFFAKKVEKGLLGKFFIVPLQVYDDSQVKIHCDYESVKHFLDNVLSSFVKYAPDDLNLIIKHHPMDRGFIDYGKIIDNYKLNYPKFRKRIFYIHDVPLPVLLRKAQGMVTLNSTSGISALLHNIPVLTLGRANYDFKGLTYQGDLDSFWKNKTPPDSSVFEAYKKYHLNRTQINGSFYNKVILRYPYNLT